MKTLVLFLVSVASFNLYSSDVTIKGAELVNNKGQEAILSIKHMGNLNDNPQIQILEKNLKITIPNSGLGNKIYKKINGTLISAAMSGAEAVTINLALPYSLAGKESNVTIALKDGMINVHYPRLETAKKTINTTENSRSPSVTDKAVALEATVPNAEAEKLDETYLSTLIKNQEKLADVKHPEAKQEVSKNHIATDRVNVAQAGVVKNAPKANGTEGAASNRVENTNKEGESRFSVAGYIGKFVAFMSLMIAGFYGVLTLFKKGIIKKGKLGFLNSTKLVEVLSTTHIAPKRSLIMVKAHKQVFLISSSETGVQFLSEINDVTGLIKTGEEEVTGSNFDTNLNYANKTDKQFRLKDDVREAYETDYAMDSLDDMLNDNVPAPSKRNQTQGYTAAANAIEKSPVKDQVRFSDQIKTKVKNLKQL